MTRSRMQVMRAQLPGQVMRHENGTITRIIAVDSERPNVDPDILFANLTRVLDRWRNHNDGQGVSNRATGFPDPDQFRDGYALQTPIDDVIYRPWPLTLRCTNARCQKAVRFRDENAWTNALQPAICDECGKPRQQIPYIMVHTCGEVRDIWWPRGCAKHDERYIYLKDRGTFTDSAWHCGGPGCNGRKLEGMRTPGCSCGEGGVYVGRTINQENRFLTHTFPFVNFERSSRVALEQNPAADAVITGYYLGLIDDYDRALHDAQNDIDPATIAAAEQVLEQMRIAGAHSSEQLQALHDQMVPRSNQALAATRSLVDPAVSAELAADQRARERTLIFAGAGGLRTWDLDEFEQTAVQAGRHGASQVLGGARERLGELGFKKVLVVENFPVAFVSYGYTRLSRDPSDVLLRPFPARKSGRTKDKVPVYVAESNTEAVFFELDPQRIQQWLTDNGLMTAASLTPANVDPDAAARAAIVMACATDPAVEHHVRLLEHTLAHALIRNLGERAGFNQNTMAEYLFPAGMLTFGLFADTHQDFTLGALVSLVEHRLMEWLNATFEGVRSCDWDPHCGRDEGACASCLHLAFGCNDFNADLSRATLIGAPAGHGPEVPDIIRGYWQ